MFSLVFVLFHIFENILKKKFRKSGNTLLLLGSTSKGPLKPSLKKPKSKDNASISSETSSKRVRYGLGGEQTSVWWDVTKGTSSFPLLYTNYFQFSAFDTLRNHLLLSKHFSSSGFQKFVRLESCDKYLELYLYLSGFWAIFNLFFSAGSAGPLRSSLKKPKNKDNASVSSKTSSKQVRISLGQEQTQV